MAVHDAPEPILSPNTSVPVTAPCATEPRRLRSSPRPRAYVLDECPARRRGLEVALSEAGCDVELVADALGFSPVPPGVAVIDVGHEGALTYVRRLHCQVPDFPIVALMGSSRPEQYCHAVNSGASCVIPHETSPDDLVLIVLGAARGWTVMPRLAARVLGRSGGQTERTLDVGDGERQWLRLLADGATVAQIAEQSGYSEREMHRRLRTLYRRLGVDGRVPAVVAAVRHGLID
jgi:DNA-binding NarL/FixJ family response regulator